MTVNQLLKHSKETVAKSVLPLSSIKDYNQVMFCLNVLEQAALKLDPASATALIEALTIWRDGYLTVKKAEDDMAQSTVTE